MRERGGGEARVREEERESYPLAVLPVFQRARVFETDAKKEQDTQADRQVDRQPGRLRTVLQVFQRTRMFETPSQAQASTADGLLGPAYTERECVCIHTYCTYYIVIAPASTARR